MLKFGNKEFRNLQEQVLANMRAIGDLKTTGIVLDEFGIKVVGQAESAAAMPSVASYKEGNPDWAYGDAYAVGTETPYSLYILTRANESHAEDYWFNIGQFPVPGPQGPEGPEGETGPQGQTGPAGQDGSSAGFGIVTASAITMEPGSDAQVSVVTLGPDTAKDFAFTFGIPRGEPGEAPELEWGNITGDISDQTDLVNVLQGKQNSLVSGTNIKTVNNTSLLGSGNVAVQETLVSGTNIKTVNSTSVLGSGNIAVQETLVSGTNIKTINNESILGSGNITIQGGGDVTDVEVNGVSVVGSDGVAEVTVPTKVSDLDNDSGFITGITSSDVTTALGYTPGTSNFSGDYDDLTDKPDLSIYAESSDLATVATTGDYDDLIDKPDLSVYAESSDLATVATTGDYDDLLDKPDLSIYAESSSLAAVATSGDYDDLLNKPTIPAAQVQSDWSEADSTKVDYIKNKPSLATVATSGSYTDLSNKPTIPTDTSDLTNGAGFITSSALSGYATETWVTNQDYITGIDSSDVISALGYTPGTSNFSGSYTDLTDKPTLGTAAAKDFTTSVTSGSADLVTAGAVFTAIDNLPEPMIFKGLVGEGGTIEWADLPAAASANEGFTYKVITAHATAPICEVGDIIISNGSEWNVIPSGDEPSGTVTSVGLSMPTGFVVTGSPITTSGTLTVSLGSGYSLLNNNSGQIISGSKTFTGTVNLQSLSLKVPDTEDTYTSGVISISSSGTLIPGYNNNVIFGSNIRAQNNNSLDLGTRSIKWKDLYLAGVINKTASGYGLAIPDTSSYTANKTIATTDQIPSVSYPVTSVTLGGSSVMSGTVAELPAYPVVPTNVSSFNNDSGYITSSALSGYATETWVGSQGYLVSSDISNMMTIDTAQTITANKTLQAGIYIKGQVSGETAKDLIGMFSASHSTHAKDIFIGDGTTSSSPKLWLYAPQIASNADNTTDLGDSSHAFKDLYLAGIINKASSGYGLAIPSTAGYTANKTIATTSDITSEISAAINAYDLQNTYKDDDTYSNATYLNPTGYITASSKEISFTFTAPKSLKNITSITVDKLQCLFRGVGGYVNGSSAINYATGSNYTINALKIDDHSIFIQLKSTTAFSGATNNTPINIVFNADCLQLTFNE